ncbi:cytochrome P450 [Myxococcus sp. K38C18041901]|uniref:cytochrome P450 n=1 Tax=Myxococcus guangdongensis TaxID=2906760 RepID=UPI0020A6F24D|nr:cytochrome P450 [Myxococcus guangdongensis]MCP3061210.1 cytochrome P450 [Myxococcus guangdongensis]
MTPLHPVAAAPHPDPYPFYAELVATRPFYRDASLGLWVASSARSVRAVLSSPVCLVRPRAEPVPRGFGELASGALFRQWARMNDGPFHGVVRRGIGALIERWGAMRGVDARARARRLLSECSLQEWVFWWPVHSIGGLLGLPPGVLPEVAAWTGDLVKGLAPGAEQDVVLRGGLAAERLRAEVRSALEAQTARGSEGGALAFLMREVGLPGDSAVDAERLVDVVVANAIGLLVQTHDATAGLIGNTLRALMREPTLFAEVAARPALLPQVLDEVLRYDPPVQNTRRYLAEDAVLEGHTLAAGECVLVVLAAANRDAQVHHEPHRFDIHREQPARLSFGWGAHGCPGEVLAKSLAVGALEVLLATDLALHREAFADVRFLPLLNGRVPLLPSVRLTSQEVE